MSTKKKSDIVLVKNHALYTQVSKLNNHCVEVHNDLSFNPYEDGILRRKNPKKILYVGRISYEKGFDRLTQFIQKINSSKNDYEFVVC